MTADSPRNSMGDPPPAEPTPAATTALSESTACNDTSASAIAVAVGRPTPSPDQLLAQNSSLEKSVDGRSPHSGGDIEIDCAAPEQTPAAENVAQVISGVIASSTAATASADKHVPPDDQNLEWKKSTLENAGSDFHLARDDVKDCYDLEECRANCYLDTSDRSGVDKLENVKEDDESFVRTPSPFKEQFAELAATSVQISGEGDRDRDPIGVEGADETKEVGSKLSHTPQGQVKVSTPPDKSSSLDEFPMSNFRNDGLLSDSIINTPDGPDLPLGEAEIDFNLLGREVMAAASTASAMLLRSDGFDSGMLLPPLPNGALTNHCRGTMMASSRASLGMGNCTQRLHPDGYPLPPYIQAHLDETYAAASTVIFPQQSRCHGAGNTFFQVTAYRQRNGGGGGAVPGNTPPATSSRPANCDEEEEKPLGKTPSPPERLSTKPVLNKKKSALQVKHRPLPLRKRKHQVNIENDGEYGPLPAGRKRALVRHNIRNDEDGSRITCKCSKSKCLKLYCDCFQQGKICSVDCECKGCKNTAANSGPDGIRTKTIEQVLARRPDAFEPRTRDAEEGCRCKKNRCLKKYCICFSAGMKCDSRCRCRNCENQPAASGEDEEAELRRGDVAPTVEIEVQPPDQYLEASIARTEPVTSTSNIQIFGDLIYQDPSRAEEPAMAAPSTGSGTSLDESIYQDPHKLAGRYIFEQIDASPESPLEFEHVCV